MPGVNAADIAGAGYFGRKQRIAELTEVIFQRGQFVCFVQARALSTGSSPQTNVR